MNVKKTFVIILLFLLLFTTVASVSADDDRSYSIEHAVLDLTVFNNGLLHVEESYDYSFDGSFNGVYRDIPLKTGEKIENVKVYAEGAYAVCEQSEKDGKTHLKIYLYSDAAHTKGIKDCDVTVHISYDMKNVVTVFNDVAGLQYKLVGEEWDEPIKSVDATIHLPADSGNEFYLNPQEHNVSSSVEGNTLKTTGGYVPTGDYYEALVLMPVKDFATSPNAKHVDKDGREMIMKNLKESTEGRAFWNMVYTIFGLLSFLSPVAAVVIYLKYGREPKVDYDGIYERDLPTNDSPEVVNALVENRSSIGTPNLKGFEASIMNLIDKKAITLDVSEDPESSTKNLFLTFKSNKGLSEAEKKVYKILNNFANDNTLNLSRLNGVLSIEANGKWFVDQVHEWESMVNEQIDVPYYFDDKGYTYTLFLSAAGIIIGIIQVILGAITNASSGFFTMGCGIFLFAFSIIIIFFKEDIFGRWTKEGREYYLKWRNLKKFLKDNSLIKEHPPESIVVWNKYLIYGTALGVADQVYKSMKLHMPNTEDMGDLYMYHYYGGYSMMNSAFHAGELSANPSDSYGFGGAGGGSGGGGGGAF